MKLSIWSSYYKELKVEEAVERFLKNGISCFELSDEHGLELLNRSTDIIENGNNFKKFINDRNFEVSQGHLCLHIKICSSDAELEKLYKWIDLYEAIGIKNMVLHCDDLVKTSYSKQEKQEKNIEKLKKLAEYIKEKDITICIENLASYTLKNEELIDGNADDLLYIIERIGSDKFGICLDTGHLNISYKNQREFIIKAADKLKALHIADNEGARDQHMMPFTRGNVDFIEVVKALKEIKYGGIFNLEIPGENRCPLELRDAKIAYIKACYDYLMSI